MDQTNFWLMFAVVSAASLLPRILPVALLSLDFPAPVKNGSPTLLLGPGHPYRDQRPRSPGPNRNKSGQPLSLGFSAALITAVKSRNLFYTLLAGILALAILNFVSGDKHSAPSAEIASRSRLTPPTA